MTDIPTGPRLIDRVRQHYASAVRRVAVPALGVELTFRPLTIADMQAVQARNPKDDKEASIYALIHKARMPDGSPAFDMGDFHFLMREADSADVLEPMLAGLYGPTASSPDADRAAKDAVASDPSSGSA